MAQIPEQRLGLEKGCGVETLGEPIGDGLEQLMGVLARPSSFIRRAVAVAARSSQYLALCPRATSRARANRVSASSSRPSSALISTRGPQKRYSDGAHDISSRSTTHCSPSRNLCNANRCGRTDGARHRTTAWPGCTHRPIRSSSPRPGDRRFRVPGHPRSPIRGRRPACGYGPTRAGPESRVPTPAGSGPRPDLAPPRASPRSCRATS